MSGINIEKVDHIGIRVRELDRALRIAHGVDTLILYLPSIMTGRWTKTAREALSSSYFARSFSSAHSR